VCGCFFSEPQSF